MQVTKVKASRVLPRLGLVKPDCPVSWVQLRPGPGLLLLLVLRLLQIGLHVAPALVPKRPGCESVGGALPDVLSQVSFVRCSMVLF